MTVENNGETAAQPISFEQRLVQLEEQLRNGEKVPPVSVRELLRWVGWQRRGSWVSFYIQRSLDKARLTTIPNFKIPYIDGLVEFRLVDDTVASTDAGGIGSANETIAANLEPAVDEAIGTPASIAADPTYRIERLRSANTTPTAVAPNHNIAEAITVMLTNDFSQLPVMVGEREVKGVISWNSIGTRLALGVKFDEVRECMEPAHVISADTSLLDAITEIVNNQYVLVRDGANKISGIVTTSDLSVEFRQLTEPFVLLGEIENHVRNLINRGNFTQEQMQQCCDPGDGGREIDGIFDLNFGEYLCLLEKKDLWSKLNFAVDRTIFVKKLDKIREIRNDVMHFDPDGITESDLDTLRKFVVFLQKLQPILRQ